MKKYPWVTHSLHRLSLATVLCFSVTGNAAELTDSVTTSDSKYYRVSYQSNVVPLPLNRIHSWVLHIDTLHGKAIENASISVHGGMPAHRHGLSTQPEVTEIGDGDYLVEGLKFSMTGVWQLWFDIQVKGITDRITFTFEL